VVALADLYLDTDVRSFLPRLAEQIVSSGVSEHELQEIWRRQVTPCVHWNLKSVAGEWSGFDRHWLLEQVQRRAEKPGLEAVPWLGDLVHRFRAYGAEREFRCAQQLARHLAQSPATERPRRVAVWLALVQVYYAFDREKKSASGAHDPQRVHSFTRQLVQNQQLAPHELVEEFRALCDLLAELLSHDERKHAAEARVAAWLERLIILSDGKA
jgi:hypothetical protein